MIRLSMLELINYSPWSVELYQDVLLAVSDELIKVLGDGDLHIVCRIIGDWLCRERGR